MNRSCPIALAQAGFSSKLLGMSEDYKINFCVLELVSCFLDILGDTVVSGEI